MVDAVGIHRQRVEVGLERAGHFAAIAQHRAQVGECARGAGAITDGFEQFARALLVRGGQIEMAAPTLDDAEDVLGLALGGGIIQALAERRDALGQRERALVVAQRQRAAPERLGQLQACRSVTASVREFERARPLPVGDGGDIECGGEIAQSREQPFAARAAGDRAGKLARAHSAEAAVDRGHEGAAAQCNVCLRIAARLHEPCQRHGGRCAGPAQDSSPIGSVRGGTRIDQDHGQCT